MALGEPLGVDVVTLVRPLQEADAELPECKAFQEKCVEIYGEPMFENPLALCRDTDRGFRTILSESCTVTRLRTTQLSLLVVKTKSLSM